MGRIENLEDYDVPPLGESFCPDLVRQIFTGKNLEDIRNIMTAVKLRE